MVLCRLTEAHFLRKSRLTEPTSVNGSYWGRVEANESLAGDRIRRWWGFTFLRYRYPYHGVTLPQLSVCRTTFSSITPFSAIPTNPTHHPSILCWLRHSSVSRHLAVLSMWRLHAFVPSTMTKSGGPSDLGLHLTWFPSFWRQ